MAEVLAGTATDVRLPLVEKAGLEHWRPQEPATFVECLGLELQHFEETELERMQTGLSWLLKQLTLTLKLKAKIRDLPSLPQPRHSANSGQPHPETVPNAAGTRVSGGSLTAEEKAAVEAMFRVEGLVNLLHKQIPAGRLSNGPKSTLPNGSTAEFAERKKCSKEAPPRTKEDGAGGQERAVLVARRKGNKIGEGGDPIGRDGSQVQALPGASDSGRDFESCGVVNSGEVRELQQLDRGGSGRQQNGGEALPLDGMNSSVDLRGEGKGSGGPGGDGNRGAGSEDGDVSRHAETSASDGGDDGNDDGAEADGDDVSEPPEETKKSISDELAEIQSSLAMISRQNNVAHGILVYLILSTTIPAMTLIRWKIQSLKFINPIKRFQKDLEKNILGKTDDTLIDELLPWKSSDQEPTDPITQQFHHVQEALGGESEEQLQINVEAEMRAARKQARKHWWQIGPFKPDQDPELLRTRTERAQAKRLEPARFFLHLIGKDGEWGPTKGR